MAGPRGPPEHPAGSHGRQQTHPGNEVLQTMVEGREGPGPHPMGNYSMSAGEVDATATLGLEDGHHHGGETPQGGQDAGVHAAVPLQHALRPVLPLLAKVLLVGLQRCYSASDEGLAFVGGWCSNKMEPEKKEVYWFHEQIHVEEYP